MHVNEPVCQSCLEKLNQCHVEIILFFNFVKQNHYDVHIAWGYRDQSAQELCTSQGKSKNHWPTSKHNHSENGQPCSLAIDLFQLTDDGHAQFEEPFYEMIWLQTKDKNLPIKWGGEFTHLKDYDHFELA